MSRMWPGRQVGANDALRGVDEAGFHAAVEAGVAAGARRGWAKTGCT